MLDLFRDGFCICGGPFGSGMWKNWKVAALKYFRPVTYMAWPVLENNKIKKVVIMKKITKTARRRGEKTILQ